MRVAIVSDTHFGDPLSTLVTTNPRDASPSIGPAYEPLVAAMGRVDLLVLLGDIIDFSVASYEEGYRQARCFFSRLAEDGLAGEIVYVPGNHDYDVWHTVEHQVNVINRLQQGQLPRAFKRSVPGVIDDRRLHDKFLLPDVAPKRDRIDQGAHYGNLFFDAITGSGRAGPKLTFNFAYPNLYLVTDEGESLLLTHGHYFEAFWSVAAEWTESLALDDLELGDGLELTLREIVGINLPLNQLACTGIGQAEPLSHLARRVRNEVSAGRTDSVEKYFDRLANVVGRSPSFGFARRAGLRALVRLAKRALVGPLSKLEHARYSAEFLSRRSVRERFRRYYGYTLAEIERLRREYRLDIPPPRHVVFGHTHQPIPWNAEELVDEIDGRPIRFCNTGGWILKEDKSSLDFVGAEVLLYESGKGVRSVSIRNPDVYPVEERDGGRRHLKLGVRSKPPPAREA